MVVAALPPWAAMIAMPGFEQDLTDMGGGAPFVVVALVAVVMGLRHATDPDHLTAVITLMAGRDHRRHDLREAARLGLAWGCGHATTLMLLGLPIVLFDQYLPQSTQQVAEVLVGLVIIGLALRLLIRLNSTRVHAHGHYHGDEEHHHRHVHEFARQHDHADAHRRPHHFQATRGIRGAFGVGLLHGIGGSAGVGVLLVAAVPGAAQSAVALMRSATAR